MSDTWPFVIAAYALTAALTLFVVAQSWLSMRANERRADQIGRARDGDDSSASGTRTS
ncbi:MAG: hypothetical protein MUF41_03730 [Sphingopyxis sp.]|nr:hypothetical protein [Sphingopyxis sp.]